MTILSCVGVLLAARASDPREVLTRDGEPATGPFPRLGQPVAVTVLVSTPSLCDTATG